MILDKLRHNFLVFSDIDGSFMNHEDYSYLILKEFIRKIKKQCQIIFTSSKTFEEIIKINKSLELSTPFIVENGACIFFPKSYLKYVRDKNFFLYKNHLGFKVFKGNLSASNKKINELKKDYKFNFLSDLDDKKIMEITNLSFSKIKLVKKRMFSNPIYWEDSESNKKQFEKHVHQLGYNLSHGGRFTHLSIDYDKGKAIKKFLKIFDVKMFHNLTTVSIGDNHNDLSMLELTDYSCVIKSKKKQLLLKKTKNNYYSKQIAPNGWQESLLYILKKERVNF